MRVRRMTSHELGTIVEVDRQLKVKWDNGQTSYFKRNERSDVRLELLAPET